ncbi:PLP-dependent aminotransferase family protein [Roseibium sp. HPY-6]|uniref:aminotransferase-like domain-containing protein n=1 Tax=Roseibium sp. HPY-6 TaxID=3229852 RepID=UPI00338F2754
MKNWKPVLPESGKPRYVEIADLIASDLQKGILMPGDRLPPQRALADLLGVDFTTVSRGYVEAKERGLVESHVGRGTFVKTIKGSMAETEPRRTEQVDLSMNLPPEPTNPDLIERMQAGLSAVSGNLISLLRYQNGTGTELDKEAASSWLSMRGLVPSLERVFITPGAHPAMMTILNMLAAPGDVVLSEAITYPGLRTIARSLKLKLVGLASDENGILPEALEEAIKAHGPKALYLNPTLQNPTTLTIPQGRRLEIAAILDRYNLPLIEDDAYGFIPEHAPSPFAAAAPDLTWHIGGLAKCIGAGLRLAYVVAPDTKAALSFTSAIQSMTVMASPVTMALATRWIQDGTADHIRRFIRRETRARQELASEIMSDFEFAADPVSFNIWLKLPENLSRAAIVGQMSGKGLGLVPSDPFTVGGNPTEHIRVCLGGRISRDELKTALQLLAHRLEYNFYS